jgi:hypothetical protein
MNPKEVRRYCEGRATIPEQVAGYVESVSEAEAVLIGDFVAYRTARTLVFVGYPLGGAGVPGRTEEAFAEALARFQPERTSLIAPETFQAPRGFRRSAVDHYHLLALHRQTVPQKVRNMVARAGRELTVQRSRCFGPEHRELVDGFLASHSLDPGTVQIMDRLPDYVARMETAWIFEARDGRDRLAGFAIGEFAPERQAFYMFSFRSATLAIPGTSDLLLFFLLQQARESGKEAVNLGLGIGSGVAHFKEKWGAKPLIPYARWDSQPPGGGVLALLQNALRMRGTA